MEPLLVSAGQTWLATWILYLVATVYGQLEEGPTDYCAQEKFEVACPEQEVILMQSALYGRMTSGRCVSGAYGDSLGCYSDVLQHMDNKCSGRRRCRMLVASLEGIVTPCPMDFKSYLQVTHTCIPVAESSIQECLNTDVIRLTSPSGYIAAGVDGQTLESYSCRWSIMARPGQRVSITLYSFRFTYPDGSSQYETERTENGVPLPCPLELFVKDDTDTKIINLCTVTKREENVFQSRAQHVDVQLTMSRRSELLPRFMVHYKAFGCPDLETTPDIWVSRDGDTVKVRCNETNETWFLTCHGDKWNGVMSNCSTKHGSSDYVGRGPRPYHRAWIVFAIIIGVILGLLVGTSLLTVVLMWRKKRKGKSSGNPVHMAEVTDLQQRPGDAMTMRSMASYPALLRQEKTIGGDVSEYTHVFEVQPQIAGQDYIQHAHTCRLGGEARAARMNARKEMTSFCPGGIRDPNYDAPCLLTEDKPMIIPKDLPLYFDMDLGLVQCPRHPAT